MNDREGRVILTIRRCMIVVLASPLPSFLLSFFVSFFQVLKGEDSIGSIPRPRERMQLSEN